MPFAPISLTVPSAATFNAAGTGKYSLSTVTFGQPGNWFLINGAKRSKSGLTTAQVSRTIEKDVVVGSSTVRRKCNIRLQIEVADGFTTAEIDNALRQIDEFVSVANLERVLAGEA